MSEENDDALDGDELVNNRWFWGRDGAGAPANPLSVQKAVAAWAELWGSGLFDGGPQNYQYMASEEQQEPSKAYQPPTLERESRHVRVRPVSRGRIAITDELRYLSNTLPSAG